MDAKSDDSRLKKLKENMSEADKIFIPKDLDSDGSFSDYAEYRVRLFKAVPENCVLVVKNRFTGRIKVRASKDRDGRIIGGGFKLLNPLVSKSILISTVDRTIDYDKCDYITKDNIMVGFDIAVVIRITNPALYKLGGQEQISQLNILIHKLLRIYAATRGYDELSKGECNLADFDREDKLREFESLYGIRVNKIIFKEVRLPERILKLRNDEEEEKNKRRAQLVKLQAEKEKAEMEAQIMGIRAEAEAKKIRQIEEAKAEVYLNKMSKLVDTLIAKGIPAQKIADYLETLIMSENKNTIFMNGSSRSNDIASGVAAGNIAFQNRNNGSKNDSPLREEPKASPKKDFNLGSEPTNTQKILHIIDECHKLGYNIPDNISNIYDSLTSDPEAVKITDAKSKEEYEQLERGIIKAIEDNNESIVKKK